MWLHVKPPAADTLGSALGPVQVKGLQAEYERVTSAKPDKAGGAGVAEAAAAAEAVALKKQLDRLIQEKAALQVRARVRVRVCVHVHVRACGQVCVRVYACARVRHAGMYVTYIRGRCCGVGLGVDAIKMSRWGERGEGAWHTTPAGRGAAPSPASLWGPSGSLRNLPTGWLPPSGC